jgi:soluble P-type ATPase
MPSDPAEQLHACRDAALLAIEAEDWPRVVKECLKAELVIATIPDSRIGNMSDLEWQPAAIRQLRKRAEEIVALGDGCALDICNVEFTGISSGGCGC